MTSESGFFNVHPVTGPAAKQVNGKAARVVLPKSPTGIRGLDEITQGGLPKGCATLVCGAAGSGKTVFGIEFIARGVTEFGEPGVYFSFEETVKKIERNFQALGMDAVISEGRGGSAFRFGQESF